MISVLQLPALEFGSKFNNFGFLSKTYKEGLVIYTSSSFTATLYMFAG